MKPAEVEAWSALIEKSARFVAHDFPGVDEDDIIQSLWEMVLKNRHRLDIDAGKTSGILVKSAKLIAWEQRKNDLYATGQYNYRPSDVRKILKDAISNETWNNTFVPIDAKSMTNIDSWDVSADVKWAFRKLSEQQKEAILKWLLPNEIELSTAERKRVDRGVDKITDMLNFYRTRPSVQRWGDRQLRRVTNNSTAQHRIAEQNGSEA